MTESIERASFGLVQRIGFGACLVMGLLLLWRGLRDGSSESIGAVVGLGVLAVFIRMDGGTVVLVGADSLEVRQRFRRAIVIPARDISHVEDWSGGVWWVHLRNGRRVQIPLHRMENSADVKAAIRRLCKAGEIPFDPQAS